jgi:CRISPR-associated protein Csh1
MISELITLTNFIEKDNPEIFEGNIKEGLHILIDLNDEGNYEIQSEIFRKNDNITNLLKKITKHENISSIPDLTDTNKCITTTKKIFSINPYSIYFKIYSSGGKDKPKIDKIKRDVNILNEDKSEEIITYLKKSIKKQLDNCIDDISNYYNAIISQYYREDEDKDKYLIENIKKIQEFITLNLKTILFKKVIFISDLFVIKDKIKLDYIDKIIWINFKVNTNTIKDASNRFYKEKIFNKNFYNITHNNTVYGLSNYLNGDNEKKLFLKHKTATFDVNNLIPLDYALTLQKFDSLLKTNSLPNPLPIFIDKEELNNKVIKIFNDENKKISYSEIIRKIYKEHKEDLNNYYILNNFKKKIVDFDFVSLFRYEINMEITDFFGIYKNKKILIDNIFYFESFIIHKIFNNSLVVKKKKLDYYYTKYFEDINQKYVRSAIVTLLYKYRKAIYDYIYKSKVEAINGIMFKDILVTTIFDDIKQDDNYSKEYSIKEKLNIYFSVNHHFDKNNKNFGGYFMPSKIPELENRIRAVANYENEHLNNDEEFAYAAGQIIYYLLLQNESTNKSHALLEPFIQKTESILFKDTITKTINKYKHSLEWYGKSGKGRFEKLTSEILGFEPEKKINELQPYILAGYFAKSFKYEKLNREENDNEQ